MKILLFLVILLNTFNFANGEIIKKIEITGNKRISTQTIKLFSEVTVNDNLDLNDIDAILKNLYNSNFFDDVSVIINNNILQIDVIEKPIIQNINYNGLKSQDITNKILDTSVLKPRYSYDVISLEKDKEAIINVLKNEGYYFSKVDVNIETIEDDKINIDYDISLGNKSKIKEITFIGNKIFKDRKLKNIIISEEHKFWKFISGKKFLNNDLINFDKNLLKNFYLNEGYYDVEINSSFAKLVDDNKFNLIFNINANEKFFFDNITLSLADDFNEENFIEILTFFKDLKNKPYSINKIKKIIDLIENIALNEQYQSVKIIPTENIISNKININFKIEETEKFYIEKINIFGNNVTQENVIRNQFEIDEGDPFNEILYNKSVNNVKSLNFFKSTVGSVEDGVEENSKIINISVQEKPTGEISLGVGTGTSGSSIGFGVKENNYLGKGIGLDATATITEESAKGKFYVTNPNYKNTDKSIYLGFDAIEIDRLKTTGYKTNKTGFTFGTDFEYLDDLNLGVGLSNFYEKISTSSTASALQKTQEGNYWDSFLKFDINYDKRNQKFQPSDGFRNKYSIDLPFYSETNTFINKFDHDTYFEMFENNVTNFSFLLQTANSLTGDNIKLSERLYIPSKNLRGFENGKIGPKDGKDYIGGNFAFATNIQATVPQVLNNVQNIDFVVFMDAANIWGVDYNSALDNMDNFRTSIGVGVDWTTPIGPLNFSLAQPITKEDSDVTETFRFNLGTTF